MSEHSTPQQVNPPDNTDILLALKRDIFTNMNCVNVGIIEGFDPADQTATIQIALKSVQDVAADGTRTIKERPVLLKCPVMMLSGGGSHITFPITVGDTCIVLFNDREIDNWFANGGLQTPNTFRKHDIADALAIVGIRNLQNAIDDYFVDGVRLAFDANSKIELSDALIESTAALYKQNGNMQVTGDETIDGNLLVKGGMTVIGTVSGDGSSNINIDANVLLSAGKELHDGRGVSGNFTTVTVEDGIVTGGS